VAVNRETLARGFSFHLDDGVSETYISAQIGGDKSIRFPIPLTRMQLSLKAKTVQAATVTSGAIHEYTCDKTVHFK
jgi:hypothetical protein